MQQIGARMDYAVARGLEGRGTLAGLVTDLHFIRPPRVLARYCSELPASKVSGDLLHGLAYRAMLQCASGYFAPHLWAAEAIVKRTLHMADKWGADVAYGFDTAFLPSMEALRGAGLRLTLEQCVAPRQHFLDLSPNLFARLEEEGVGAAESGLLDQVEHARLQSLLEAEEWRHADLVLAPSDFVAQTLVQRGVQDSRIMVVPYGVSLPGGAPDRAHAPHGRPRVAFVGGLTWRKGALEYLRLARVLSSLAEFHLFGICRIPLPIVRRLAPNLVMNGHLNRSELIRRLAECDLMVLPSWWEGSATVVYEAMALGVPCIVTPETGSVITHGQDGLIVPAGDDEALEAAAEGLLHNPEQRHALGAQAARTARRYTRESYGERVADAVASALDISPSPQDGLGA